MMFFRKAGGARLLAPVAALCLLAGPASAQTPKKAAKIAPLPKLQPVDFPTFKRALGARRGKVLVVNYWATWCAPCLEKLPYLTKLNQRYKSKGVELVNVSFDTQRALPAAQATLAKNGLTTGNYLQQGTLEDFVVGMEPNLPADKAVNLPRTYIFDRQGKLVKMFDDGHTTSAIEKAVLDALARKG